MKRIIPMLLCIAMLLAMLPLTASAYGFISGGTIIVNGITAPIAGNAATVSGIAATSTNLELYDAPYWCDAGGNKFTDKFQPDATYYLELHVSGKGDVGYINDTTSIDLQIDASALKIDDEGYAGNYRIYHVWFNAVKHYGGFEANYGPKLTIAPANLSAALTPNDVQITTEDMDYDVDALIVFHKKGGGEVAFDEHFEAGERYTATFTLTVKKIEFTVFDDGVIAFINGDSCDGTVYAYGKTAEFAYEFPNPATAEAITSVALTQISTPAVGEGPQQAQFATSTPHVSVSLLGWREGTAQTGEDVTVFEAGKIYTLWLRLNPDENYELALADKSAVTASAGTVATLTTGWQGDNGSYYSVGVEFKTPADPATLDLGTCTVDLSGTPILADTVPQTAKNELGFLALGGYVGYALVEGAVHNYDIDKDGKTDFAIYDEDGKTYWAADPDTNLKGSCVIDLRELVPEMIENCAATDTEFYSKLEFVFAGAACAHEKTEIKDAKEATCTEAGCTGDTYCVDCGEKLAAGEEIPALGHDFKDGVCTRCGEKDPDAKPCDGGENCPSKAFTDVNKGDWYHEAVDFAVTKGLFNGMSETTFEPNTPMSRAMLVTVLWRYEGKPMEGTNDFTDVPAGQWYTDAVAWAAKNGIVNGVGDGKFDPDGKITREQLAAILFRYSGNKGYDVSKRDDFASFPDKEAVSSWATDAYGWAVAEKLISGNDGKLDPQGDATRAQVATILMRFIKKFA